MFDKTKIQIILDDYKKNFRGEHWEQEKYKWIAVKHFQDNWDIEAEDFKTMFKNATAKCFNLLSSMNYFPARMIEVFSDVAPEDTRKMFRDLYDESISVITRVENFEKEAERIRATYGGDNWKSHYQNSNSISTYLWLRYPDKYYIYKYTEYKNVSVAIDASYKPQKGARADSLLGAFKMYDEIAEYLKTDEELLDIFKNNLTEDCHSDTCYHTLTVDFGYYISKYYQKKAENEFGPSLKEYDPAITVNEWKKIVCELTENDDELLIALTLFYSEKNGATSSYLHQKYGFQDINFSLICTEFCEKVYVCTGKKEYKSKYDIAFLSKPSKSSEIILKLRDELFDALTLINAPNLLHTFEQTGIKKIQSVRYWIYSPGENASMWDDFYNNGVMGIGWKEMGNLSLYNDEESIKRALKEKNDLSHNPTNSALALWQFVNEVKPGDVIFAKKGMYKIIGRGVVESEYYYEPDKYERYPNLRKVNWNAKGEWDHPGKAVMKTITDITQYAGYVEELNKIIDGSPEYEAAKTDYEKYSKEDFLKEVFIDDDAYKFLKGILLVKKNVILQGAPGVGKTFTAKRLAYSIMGEKDDSRVELVQFHQNYSYEDFVMGYKPVESGFELKNGIFYRFCQRAENNPDKEFFFIIDEINRGNLSKIFGELLMSIEKDYRGTPVTLAYSSQLFSVPENIYIIGMMNTADRSLAMIDYALRRRFSFFDMEPGFKSEGFKAYRDSLGNNKFNETIDLVCELNEEIEKDKSLGKGFCIGHSYFCNIKKEDCTDIRLKSIINYEILPMLSEYWFDDQSKYEAWEKKFDGVF